MDEEPQTVFLYVAQSKGMSGIFRMALRKEEFADANYIKEAFKDCVNTHSELREAILKMKYWYIQSKADMYVANEIRNLFVEYPGLVFVKDEVRFMINFCDFRPEAITQREAVAKYGVEIVAEAFKEAEPLANMMRDKLKQWNETYEKLKEEAKQPETIRKRLKKTEAKVEAIRKELEEAEAKQARQVVAMTEDKKRKKEEEEEVDDGDKRKKMVM